MIVNKNKLIKLMGLLSIIISIIAFFPQQVKAASESDSASTGSFTYSLEFPENQTDTTLGYFHLMMEPSQQQTINLVLSNPSEVAVTVNLALNGAKTNQNGVVEYSNSEIENDASLAFSFTDIVTGPASVELAAGETKSVPIDIQMPETSYDGIIAGGVQMMLADQGESESSSGGSQVVNQYAYVFSIVLQETDVELTPDLQWNSAYGGQNNYRNSMFINFSNVVADFLNNMNIDAKISAQGSSEVLYESRTTSLRMAPNSFIEYPISMNGDRMEAGMYTAQVVVTTLEGGHWEWTEDFEITEDEANQYNERDVGLVQDTGLDWRLIAVIAGGFLAVVLLAFLVVRQIRKNKKKAKKGTKSNKKKKST
ncbi:DUF916 and DUF3324 domain-containing protein [Enterococcus sp. HY326]|uniref:DUF916 and DUF3324 domain-containing protein n=1 Tax=Enterococcus sp. HY326 TaxID=2971265 RepID=UPI00223EB000|nr:DUF916 and DUF3324 domain-containing protein [Enterococcus sp. HY326]